MVQEKSLQEQIDYLRNDINRLSSSIIGVNVRITSEMVIHKTTFRDIDILKEAHQREFEHSHHENSAIHRSPASGRPVE